MAAEHGGYRWQRRRSRSETNLCRATLTDARPTASKWPSTFDSRTLEVWSSDRPLSRNSRSLVWCRRSACQNVRAAFLRKRPSWSRFTSRQRQRADAISGWTIAILVLNIGQPVGLEFTTSSQILVCATAVRWTGSTITFCAPVAHTYAPSFGARREHRGGLAPWQKRRATELFATHLDGSLRLVTLAHECGLSVSYFYRSFRKSFGTSPRRYLIQQRVERAKQLMRTSRAPLSQLALETGFPDQATFSRTFKALAGNSPGRWRREAQYRRLEFE